MEKEKNFEQIEAYLKGKLKGEKKKAFEERLKKETPLAEELNIHKDMAKALASSPKDEFRKTLKEVDKELSTRSNNIKAGSWVLLGLLLFLLASLVFFFNLQNKSTSIPEEEAVEKVVPPPPSVQGNRPVIPSEEKESIEEVESQPLRDIPKEKIKESNPITEPIALNFNPNPALEEFINNPSRSNGPSIDLYQPFENSTALIKDGSINFSIDGAVEIEEGSSSPSIQLLVFSNKPSDYENFKAIYKQTLVLNKEADKLIFQIREKLELEPGLYYLYFENLNSGEVYLVRKFSVKRRLN